MLDPNITACKDFRELAGQLIESKARIDFTQGIDIRTMTDEKAELIRQMKVKTIHFAWDRYQDKDFIVPKFKMFKDITGFNRGKMSVYVLTNFDTTIEQDLERIYTLRDLGYHPDVRVYNKQNLPKGHDILKMQRWVNNPWIFYSGNANTFEDYKRGKE